MGRVSDVLVKFTDPEVLAWADSDKAISMTATVTGSPFDQNIITEKIDLADSTITGIEKAEITSAGSPLFAVSVDGSKWEMWNGTEWAVLSEEHTGMTAAVMTAVTAEQWTALIKNTSFIMLRMVLTGADDTITKVVIDFTN